MNGLQWYARCLTEISSLRCICQKTVSPGIFISKNWFQTVCLDRLLWMTVSVMFGKLLVSHIFTKEVFTTKTAMIDFVFTKRLSTFGKCQEPVSSSEHTNILIAFQIFCARNTYETLHENNMSYISYIYKLYLVESSGWLHMQWKRTSHSKWAQSVAHKPLVWRFEGQPIFLLAHVVWMCLFCMHGSKLLHAAFVPANKGYDHIQPWCLHHHTVTTTFPAS